ncbi:MAG: cytochrome c biogenesis protein CcdA [Actinomycetota bacterium]
MLLALSIAFGNGVLSFAAPCTVPLLPAYLGLLTGVTAGLPPGRRAGRIVLASLLYVAGFALVFALFGIRAGSTGGTIRLDGAGAQRVGGVVVVLVLVLLLSQARFGWLTRVGVGSWQARSLWVPVAVGVAFGAAFTPCVGPFLATALALAANRGDGSGGGVVLLAYALGVGVPFVLAALGVAGSERLARLLAGRSASLCYFAAGALGVLGLLLLAGRYDVLSGWMNRLVIVSSS